MSIFNLSSFNASVCMFIDKSIARLRLWRSQSWRSHLWHSRDLRKIYQLCHMQNLQKLCSFTFPASLLVGCAVFMTSIWSPYTANIENQQCNIKGNISGSGAQVYHLPDSPWYGRTQIDPKQGEQWFCSETAARQAGWRSASYKRKSKSGN